MTIIQIVIALIVIGVVLYIVNSVIPLDPKIKTILNAVVILAVLLWLLGAVGLLGSGGFWNSRVGR